MAVRVINCNRMKNSACLLLAAFSCWGAEVKLPPPGATPSANNRPRVMPKPADAQLKVPDGFTIELFDDGFEQPRYMTLGPSVIYRGCSKSSANNSMANPSGTCNWAPEGLGITRGRLVTEGVAPGGGSLTSAPQQEKAANRRKALFFIRLQFITRTAIRARSFC